MFSELIKKSKKMFACAAAVLMTISSVTTVQAYTNPAADAATVYAGEAEEALYGTRIWNFVDDSTEGCYTDTETLKSEFDFNGMRINATNSNGITGKKDSTAMEPGVILTIPAAGNYTVSVAGYYYNGAGFKIGEKDAASEAQGDHTLSISGTIDGSGTVSLTTYGNGIWVKTITVTCSKPAEPSDFYGTREWKFDGSDGSYSDTTNHKDVFEFNGITIDATQSGNGVSFNTSNTKFEPTVTVTIPAAGNYALSVEGYFWNNAIITVDEVSSGEIAQGDRELNFAGKVKDGKITLTTAKNGAWIRSIKVTCTEGYDPIEAYAAGRKVDVWDFGGVEEADTNIYTNYITKEFWDSLDASLFKSNGTFSAAGEYVFGDLTLKHHDSDRLYYNNADNTAGGKNSAATTEKYGYTFADGYVSRGAYYAAGSGANGGQGSRYAEIVNVLPGDVITAYMMVENNDMDLHFLYQGSEGAQDDITTLVTKEYTKVVFTAEYAGTYKIWLSGGGKPRFLRVTRAPGVLVKGTIDLTESGITDYNVILEDKTSGKRFTAAVYEDGSFAALVPANSSFSAILTGAKGYGFTDISKSIQTTDSVLENVSLVVEAKNLSVLTGTISGFAADFDKTNLKFVLSCTDEISLKEDVALELKDDWTYTAELENQVEYQLTMTGANDYELAEAVVVSLNEDGTKNISVKAKTVYQVTGSFLGLSEGGSVKEIKFTNLEDGYIYTGTVTDNSYEVLLRDGEYEISAPVAGYSMIGHVVVSGADTVKDLLYISSAKESMELVSDIYVGYPSREMPADALNYDTVREAVKACAAMSPSSEADRITVHIYPGTYREQVIIETPYITFVNDDPEREVLLTWYYAVGYKYYSASEAGYYDENLAYDQYTQNSVNKWGASVYVKSNATDFKAENITFEASFNRYLTQEEMQDGAQPDMKEAIRVLREEGLDVTTKAATERACALAIDADRAEFKNCTILGSQDTLFIQLNTHTYFKDCLISGNTDYIFGDGDAVFDDCELQWYGYKDVISGGYITAVQNQAPKGCLFRNCIVTANTELQVSDGCFGRPWREGAHVIFLNTVLESENLIRAAGWADMSGGKAENSFFREYNTTLTDGTPVDTSGRVRNTVMTCEEAAKIEAIGYFGGWMPIWYEEKASIEVKEEVLEVEKFADVNIIIPQQGISKEQIMVQVPTGAAVTFTSGREILVSVVWNDFGLEADYTEAVEFTLTGILAEVDNVSVQIKVILTAAGKEPAAPDEPDTPDEPIIPEKPDDPEEPDEPEKPLKPQRPTVPSYDDDDSDNYSSDYTKETELTYAEQSRVENVLGADTVVADVVECEAGKLVIGENKEIVFCEENGALSSGKWQKVYDDWYYFGSDSRAAEGWIKPDDKWYYMDEQDKTMKTGWLQTENGQWYLLDEVNGDMKTGWQKRDGKWYLLDEVNGDMKTGWQFRNGFWYLLDTVNGDMKTGWQKTADGKWYYLTEGGAMAANTVTPDGYKVDASGAWIQ